MRSVCCLLPGNFFYIYIFGYNYLPICPFAHIKRGNNEYPIVVTYATMPLVFACKQFFLLLILSCSIFVPFVP